MAFQLNFFEKWSAKKPSSGLPPLYRELTSVCLWALGLLSIFALGSYQPRDVSLNAKGSSAVQNWIGPAGAYGADLLLQIFGLSAFFVSTWMLWAGWRIFCSQKPYAGFRKTFGLLTHVWFLSALLQLISGESERTFPPGGVFGVLLSRKLREQCAPLGAYIVCLSLVALSGILIADGVLLGMHDRMQRLATAAQKRWQEFVQDLRQALKPRPKVKKEKTARIVEEPVFVEVSDEANILIDEGDAESGVPALAAAVPAPKVVRSNSDDGPVIVDPRPTMDVAQIEKPRVMAEKREARSKPFELPSTSLLDFVPSVRANVDPAVLRDNASKLTQTLKHYGIEGHVREIRPGPVVTMYEYVPGPGIKLSRIASLADDLAMSMEALRVRIVAPIPGKGAVGIEIPNESREVVYLKELFAHDVFQTERSKLTLALGKDIEGKPYIANLAKMPHLLVAGATGAGKSVSLNSMIMSVLFKSTPEQVRMLMVDPKMLELSVYEGIPHLLLPVVTDPKKAATALKWAVAEMERRYQLLSDASVRSIDGYNKKVEQSGGQLIMKQKDADDIVCQRLPYILVIVDEFADLMMVAGRDVEASIMRLAQMARAAGIHLILATQRPSVDVITGVIKANFPTRVAFQVASRHDSRTIIDGNGAENLLGRGDMLFQSPGAGGLIRVHGAYVSEEEIERTVKFLKDQGAPEYDESILLAPEEEATDGVSNQEFDEFYDQAVAIVAETKQASISMIQRRLRIGYNRAARLVERMEAQGIVGPADGAKPREVLVSSIY
jgi:DNA segregation ATPase FtsK/SpoIIIE, S-DNA-T family